MSDRIKKPNNRSITTGCSWIIWTYRSSLLTQGYSDHEGHWILCALGSNLNVSILLPPFGPVYTHRYTNFLGSCKIKKEQLGDHSKKVTSASFMPRRESRRANWASSHKSTNTGREAQKVRIEKRMPEQPGFVAQLPYAHGDWINIQCTEIVVLVRWAVWGHVRSRFLADDSKSSHVPSIACWSPRRRRFICIN